MIYIFRFSIKGDDFFIINIFIIKKLFWLFLCKFDIGGFFNSGNFNWENGFREVFCRQV